jgi:hypothetical protein
VSLAGGFAPFARYLTVTVAILVVSRVFYDLVAGRAMFWASQEQALGFLWTCLVGGPFVLFALLVTVQRSQTGSDR